MNVSRRRHTNGQRARGRVLGIADQPGDANQKPRDGPPTRVGMAAVKKNPENYKRWGTRRSPDPRAGLVGV